MKDRNNTQILKKINYMHLLSAALLERQQTHSETVNERGVAGEVELKVMCILVRAGILQTWHDVLDLRVTLFSLVLRKVMSGVGRERERGFWKYNLQSSIFLYLNDDHLEKQNLTQRSV